MKLFALQLKSCLYNRCFNLETEQTECLGKCECRCNISITQTVFIYPIIDMNCTCLLTFGKKTTHASFEILPCLFNTNYRYLKLVCNLLNTHVLGTNTAAIFLSNDHSLYAPINRRRMSCMISFVWHQTICQERIESGKNEKWKNSCTQWDSNLQPWDLMSDALPTELTGLRCKLYYLNDLYIYTYMYFLYQCIH